MKIYCLSLTVVLGMNILSLPYSRIRYEHIVSYSRIRYEHIVVLGMNILSLPYSRIRYEQIVSPLQSY